MFAGSFLLFLIQPMIARMALPRLGGSPSVWNSAMLVYQALLLGGYAFAHWLGRFPARTQGLVQAGGLLAAAMMLPLHLSGAMPPPDANAFIWVPWLLIVSVGPVFLFVSAQAPLIQRWYALSGEGDPYPLYAASNLGSFAGLLSYPLLVEPLLTVSQQSAYWSIGYVLLIVLVSLIAVRLPTRSEVVPKVSIERSNFPRATVAKWIGLAAIPSGLMLSTTLHLTTDLVAMPLLWVGPLGLYLLSFSVAFAADRRPAQFISTMAPLFLIVACWTLFTGASTIALAVAGFSLVALFVISVAIHSLLFELRPDPSRLTAFYLAMSTGGVVGGLFCALFAPLLFDWTYEHPLLMLAAAWCCGGKALLATSRTRFFGKPLTGRAGVMIGVVIISLANLATIAGLDKIEAARSAIFGLFGIVALLALGNRLLFAAALAALMLFAGGLSKIALSIEPGRMTRSFFGINTIGDTNDNARVLIHGTTVHGIQATGSQERERRTTSYYAPQSGVGLAMTSAPALFGAAARIDVVGLGAGTLGCYARPGQAWRFYEIDPVMVDIAKTRFTFLSRCLPRVPIELGDARLTLARRPTASTDLLVIDAFSSDSVPMHLLTLEAFATYRRTLAANGLLLVHISNRFLDLEPVLAAAARHGWDARIRDYKPTKSELELKYSHSVWVALSPSPNTMTNLVASSPAGSWDTLDRADASSAWTDEHATILPIIKWREPTQ
ncbi:MAG: fused MFS/spermidine synthase [Sphingomonas bacterium]|nr:fused MFS/spermidine synthase [Sphingomonas bacterium]